MKKKIAIVTGADKKYFPYLKNLVHSLQKSKTLEICDLCILLIDDDNKYLTDIDYLFNNKKKVSFSLKLFFKDKQNWYKLLTERPFLKDHFPGYEKYIWLDADTEVLDVQGINNLITATEKNDLAIERINQIIFEPKTGNTYNVKVIKILDFGAVVEFVPGKEVLLHISELAWERVNSVNDVLKINDTLDVKYFGIDPKTRKQKVSRKALLPRPDKKEDKN